MCVCVSEAGASLSEAALKICWKQCSWLFVVDSCVPHFRALLCFVLCFEVKYNIPVTQS